MSSRLSKLVRSPLAIVFFALCCGLFIPFHVTADRIFWQRVLDAGHFPALGLLAFVFALFLSRFQNRSRKVFVIAFVLVTLFAGLAEFLQLLVGRSAQWGDFWRGAIGAAMGVLGAALFRYRVRWPVLAGYVIVGVAIMLVFAGPAYRKWEALRYRDHIFPTLANFSNPIELELWRSQGRRHGIRTKIELAFMSQAKDSSALRIVTVPNAYSGIRYQSAERSWAAYQTLSARIFNPGLDFKLAFRVDDDKDPKEYGQRFNRTEVITHGWNTINIPIRDIMLSPRGRTLDVSQVQQLLIFVPKQEESKEFFVDRIWLE